MTDDWFWRPDRLPQTRSLLAATTEGGQLVPTLAGTSSLLQFDVAEFNRTFQLAVQALRELLARSPLAGRAVLYDPRLETIRAYFLSAGRGDLAMPTLALAVRAEVLAMRDAPLPAILGCELAKAGFITLGLPQLAAPFAREAARGWTALRQVVEATHSDLEIEELPEGETYDWR